MHFYSTQKTWKALSLVDDLIPPQPWYIFWSSNKDLNLNFVFFGIKNEKRSQTSWHFYSIGSFPFVRFQTFSSLFDFFYNKFHILTFLFFLQLFFIFLYNNSYGLVQALNSLTPKNGIQIWRHTFRQSGRKEFCD